MPVPAKPRWLKVNYNPEATAEVVELMNRLHLNTVCREANCPNLGECYKRHTATFMILGRYCTRDCRFCDVIHGAPEAVDASEPQHVADAAKALGARHVVVTSVTRDDLPDGGAAQFAAVIRAIRATIPGATVEVLIPDLKADPAALEIVFRELPDVLGHNVETVPSLYQKARPQAIYERSLQVLQEARTYAEAHRLPGGERMLVKSGIMLGLGETDEELDALFHDLAAHGCDILSIGQYLQPSPSHVDLVRYVPPADFDRYKAMAEAAGIAFAASSPLVRSSYHADEALAAVRAKDREKA